MQGASSTVLHDYINGDVLFVDGIIEVSQDVHVVQPDEGIDFIDYVFLLFGGERAERDLLQHHLSLGGE